MKILGVDIGITGSYALLDGANGGVLAVGDLPTMWNGKKSARVKYKIDAAGWALELRTLWEQHGDSLWVAYVEPIASRPAQKGGKVVQGQATTFSLGHSTGAVEGVLGTLGIRSQTVVPPVWKNEFRLVGLDKEASRSAAIQLYPHLDGLHRKKDHNRAEAVLIGVYGWRREAGALQVPTSSKPRRQRQHEEEVQGE